MESEVGKIWEILGLVVVSILGLIITGATTVFVAVLFYKLLKNISERQREIRELRENGEPAQAKLLRVQRTGRSINDEPEVKMLLSVEPANRPPYEAEILTTWHEIPGGVILPVKIDRNNPQKIILDFDLDENYDLPKFERFR